jgi:hypothetical protein
MAFTLRASCRMKSRKPSALSDVPGRLILLLLDFSLELLWQASMPADCRLSGGKP